MLFLAAVVAVAVFGYVLFVRIRTREKGKSLRSRHADVMEWGRSVRLVVVTRCKKIKTKLSK